MNRYARVTSGKLLLIKLALFGFVAGCSAIATYDPVQYNHFNELVSIAQIGEARCSSADSQKQTAYELSNKMIFLNNYVRYAKANEFTVKTLRNIDTLVTEFSMRVATNKASEDYCKTKLEIISLAAANVQRTLGNAK